MEDAKQQAANIVGSIIVSTMTRFQASIDPRFTIDERRALLSACRKRCDILKPCMTLCMHRGLIGEFRFNSIDCISAYMEDIIISSLGTLNYNMDLDLQAGIAHNAAQFATDYGFVINKMALLDTGVLQPTPRVYTADIYWALWCIANPAVYKHAFNYILADEDALCQGESTEFIYGRSNLKVISVEAPTDAICYVSTRI
jgi:hypothetical protein